MRLPAVAIIPFVFFAFHPFAQVLAQQSFTLRGTVQDAITRQALVGATVRIDGTAKGTITNSQGVYNLSLEQGDYRIIISYIGYRVDTARVLIAQNIIHDAALLASEVLLAEEIVTGEGPAIEIIRKAIANKHNWMNLLKSYQFEAFTRQIIRRDTTIAGITESYTTGYWRSGDTLREVIHQKWQTANIPAVQNIAAVGRIINFNDDEIKLLSLQIDGTSSSYTFVGPTAPEALDYYDYKLLRTLTSHGFTVYEIKMIPKSRLTPLFEGIIKIADESFAVMGVDVQPNEAFVIPFVNTIKLRYQQQFNLYDQQFWMPADIRIRARFEIGVIGLSLPLLAFEQTSAIYDYRINPQIPDSVFQKPRRTTSPSAEKFDSTYWAQNQVLALTAEEQTAYKSLDSTQSIQRQFEPRGPLTWLASGGTPLKFADVHFNRVEGLFLGADLSLDSLMASTAILGAFGYGFSDRMIKYRAGIEQFITSTRSLGVGLEVYRKLGFRPNDGSFGTFAVTVLSLFDKNDYRDYYLARGWRGYLVVNPERRISFTANYLDERETTVSRNSDFSIFNRSKPFRVNPPSVEGRLRSFRLNARFGDPFSPLAIISRNTLELEIEHSSPKFLKSDFDFTRYVATLEWRIATLFRSYLFPATLHLRFSAGIKRGVLPPQRLFDIDAHSSGLAPYGVLHAVEVKEFSGDRFAVLSLEHNFRSIPFLFLGIPFFYKNNLELVLEGAIARSWLSSETSARLPFPVQTTNCWYYETGIGLNRIFGIGRLDLIWRMSQPTNVSLSLRVASLF